MGEGGCGDYSREAILIEGRLLFEEILYVYFYLMDIFVQEEGPTTVWVTYFTVKDVSPEFKCFKN